MSKREVVQNIINQALASLNQERDADEQIEIKPSTPLFGPDAVLNSLELVSVMVDVETLTADEFGRPVALTDDKAMEQDPVPFTNAETLTTYIVELLSE